MFGSAVVVAYLFVLPFAHGFKPVTHVLKCRTPFATSVSNRKPLTLQESVLERPVHDKGLSTEHMQFSTLQGKALAPKSYPTLSDLKSKLPADTFVKSTPLSMAYAAQDIAVTAATIALSYYFLLPVAQNLLSSGTLFGKIGAFAIWALYSFITGTAAIGAWVTAHECGHGAFSDNRKLQDVVGYVFHSLMLVPYFSWQRSHAVHHANTNHIDDGETHVPPIKTRKYTSKQLLQKLVGKRVGHVLFGFGQASLHLLAGWPAYLLGGATGGPSRGLTNHFIPLQVKRPFQKIEKLKELYPGSWKPKVLLSDLGVAAVLAGLGALVAKFGLASVALAYGGPYLVVNAWLVGYTWLQHTEVDVPHLPADDYSFIKGAFHTIDRPYENMLGTRGVIDYLHHHIGSTHVAHHVDSTIPHYRSRAATEAIKEHFPEQYLYESTPIMRALWRVASKCFVVEKRKHQDTNQDLYVFVDP